MSTNTVEPSIHTGFWVNWSYGRVQGSTFTLSLHHSAYLVAFIALFVRLAGGQLWGVIAFLASVKLSSAKPEDGLYHQQQAILRNASSPASVTWDMFKLSWFWKKTPSTVKRRTLALLFSSFTYIAAFAVAGIFSSKVASANSEVLLVPTSSCGNWPLPYAGHYTPKKDGSWQDYTVQQIEYWANANLLAKKSHAYTSQCQKFNSTQDNPSSFCLPYGRDRISWSTNTHAACPFDRDMCIADAVQFDTGFLNSHTHFGINEKETRIEYRRVMTCAPITTDGYVASSYVSLSDLNVSETYGIWAYEDEKFLRYNYGQSAYFQDNTTYALSNYSFDTDIGYGVVFPEYHIDIEYSVGDPNDTASISGASFVAIPELTRSDADTTLIFLSQNGSYASEVVDPWFKATQKSTSTLSFASGQTYNVDLYYRDAPVTVLGCAEQHQLRNPLNGATSRLSGEEIVTAKTAHQLGFNEDQMAIYNRSIIYGSWGILWEIVPALFGGTSLLATQEAWTVWSTALPSYQWQIELDHWFGVALNAIQLWTLQYVSGPTFVRNDRYVVPPTTEFEKRMCNNQIVRSSEYRSFSVLGIAVILSFGIFFIILNLFIRQIVEDIQKHTVKGRYRNAEWQANDFLQLQRMAYQHNNIGTWTGHKELVPRTSAGELFTLPESTNWNQPDVSKPPPRDRNMFQSLSRGWSRDVKQSQPHAPSSETSSVSIDEEAAISPIDEKTPVSRIDEKGAISRVDEESVSDQSEQAGTGRPNLSSVYFQVTR